MTQNVKKPMVDIRDLWMRVLDERVSAVEAEVNRRMNAHKAREKDVDDASKAS